MTADEVSDAALIALAVDGDRASLQALIERHQPFVYNIALKMFGNRSDAQDLTQEVLVKVITSLRSFRRESSFRTWIYRITANHFLNTRRRGMELSVESFERYFATIDETPDETLAPEELELAGATIAELRVRCTTGMLMCLDRHQRLVFILGAMFAVPHTIGGEILDLSPGNFRVRLHRARTDLYSWMNQRCGLVNEQNPCRCHKKTRAYVRRGVVDPERLVFTADHRARVAEVVRRDADGAMDVVADLHERIFEDHPFHDSAVTIIDDVLANPTLRAFFDLS